MGLIEAPGQLLTEKEWESAKEKSNKRDDSKMPCVICKEDFGTQQQVLGADPGFLKGGFKFTKGGSFTHFHLHFLKFPHENKVIWSQWGVQVNPPNPL